MACLPLLLWTAPALAVGQPQSVELAVDSSAWTWRQTLPGVEPSNVPPGGLPVQFDGRPDAPPAKATYLRIDVSSLPAGTLAQRLTLRLPLDASVSQDPTSAPLVACRLTAAFATGEQVDPATAPAEDCKNAARGVFDPAQQAVSFVVTPFAAAWLQGQNFGLVVRPDPAAAVPSVLPFQLVFQGPTAVGVELLAVLPSAPLVPPVETAPPAPLLPEPQVGPAFPAPLPGVLTPAPVAQPEFVPPVLSTPAPVRPAAAAPRASVDVLPAGRSSAAGFALAAALGAVMLALIGWSFGSACDPGHAARRERSRADRMRPVVGRSAQTRQMRQGRKPAASAASTVT
jgi:hypothetical protein